MKIRSILVLITSILLLSLSLFQLISTKNEKELKAILEDERIETLIHQEEVPNGIVIFYVPNLLGDGTAEASFEARFI